VILSGEYLPIGSVTVAVWSTIATAIRQWTLFITASVDEEKRT